MFCYIIIILFVIFIFVTIKKYESFDENKYFITFGGGGQNYYDAAERITNEVKQLNVFNNYITYKDTDLKNDEFWETHSEFVENNKRGYGYWLWKPYIILKTLKSMNSGEILLYLDGGCEISNGDMNELIDRCKKYDILYTLTGQIEKKYTKMDLFLEMKLNTSKIKDDPQYQASAIFLKKNDKIMNFVNEWYNISSKYHLIDDSESLSPNDNEFIEHRHDQSVFSLLIKKYNYDNKDNIFNEGLIKISRNRNG